MCEPLLPMCEVRASKSKNKSMASVTFTPAAVKSKVLAPHHRHEKRLKSFMCYKIVYYVPRQSSKKQFNCLGTYDTLSEIRKKNREIVCREAEVKLRLIGLRTCTFRVISNLYRNKLDVVERGDGGSGGKAPEGCLGASPPPLPPRGGASFGGFSAARRDTIKCNFTAVPQAGK